MENKDQDKDQAQAQDQAQDQAELFKNLLDQGKRLLLTSDAPPVVELEWNNHVFSLSRCKWEIPSQKNYPHSFDIKPLGASTSEPEVMIQLLKVVSSM